MSNLIYRPEIDGLRALSVLAVLLFHADVACPGGYVGVDVFFVISGYLITRLILRDFDAGTVSFAQFWERRVRRILPASLFLTVCVLLAGYLFLVPSELEDLAKSAVSHLLLASNVYFWRLDWYGYFGVNADAQPLLHTWSLSIEEQFYFFYPFLLYVLRRRSRATICAVLSGCWIASFLTSVWGLTIGDQRIATFYLLPTRGWELLTGAMVAVGFGRSIPVPRLAAEIASIVGLAGIVGPIFLYDRATLFPAWAALPPCLGCGAVIALNAQRATLVGRALARKPFVSIGLISYSLYLWHWPIFSFHRICFGALLPPAEAWMLIAASLAAGWFSWRFIETPFREHRLGFRRATLFAQAAAAAVLLLAVSSWFWREEGFRDRSLSTLIALEKDVDFADDDYVVKAGGEDFEYPTLGVPHVARIDFAVWGDSHAQALDQALDEAAVERQLSGRLIAVAGRPPMIGVWRKEEEEELAWSNAALRYLVQRRVPCVLLVARWRLYLDGGNAWDSKRGNWRQSGILHPAHSRSADRDEARRLLFEKLDETLTALEQNGTRIWVLRQVPEQNETDLAKRWLRRNTSRLPWLFPFDPTPVRLNEHLQMQKNANRLFDEIARRHPAVTLIDPTPAFFDDPDSTLPIIHNGRCLYWDDDHLSRSGAKWLIENDAWTGIRAMLDEIASKYH